LSGELVGVNAGKIWINDGNINKRIYISESIPDGWVKGMLKKKKVGLSRLFLNHPIQKLFHTHQLVCRI
jgi:hypothetical protein